MPIPSLDSTGLLPEGIHDCSLSEIEMMFGWNSHRLELFGSFKMCLATEIRPIFSEPIYFDGSFVTDKELPDDIDMFLEFNSSSNARKFEGLIFLKEHQNRIMENFRVHFWVSFPGANDFCRFFQYVGIKTANTKGLNPKHKKGILRIA